MPRHEITQKTYTSPIVRVRGRSDYLYPHEKLTVEHCQTLEDINIDEQGAAEQRNGYEKYNSNQVAADAVGLGLLQQKFTDTTTLQVEVFNNAKIYTDDGTTRSDKTGTAEVDTTATSLVRTAFIDNTIFGTEWFHVPRAGVPLVADMSSDFLSRPIDLAPHGLLYAGAQKNAGPAGVTIVMGRKGLLREFRGAPTTPTILRYKTHAEADSLLSSAYRKGWSL